MKKTKMADSYCKNNIIEHIITKHMLFKLAQVSEN